MQVYELKQGDSLYFDKEDLSILKHFNKDYKRIWDKYAIKFKTGQIVEFNKEIVGILNIRNKIVIITPRIKNFDFNLILRMWTFLNFFTLKNKS